MRLLAWDTSSKSGTLVALEWDPFRLVSEWTLNVDTTHSEQLLWALHQLLESARWELEDIDLFGVGMGPGSFTGLRIGLTTARTLAHVLRKPLVGVSSLAALARPAALALSQVDRQALLIATTDACKGELFALWGKAPAVARCAVPQTEQQFPGLWHQQVQESVITPIELIKAVVKKKKASPIWLAIGEGRKRYPEIWKSLPSKKELIAPFLFSDHVQGRYLGILVKEAYEAGLAKDPLQVSPRYIRASDAELKLKAGLLPRSS